MPKRLIAVAAVLICWTPGWAQAPTPLGGEFQVNAYTTNTQSTPDLVTLASGDFVVVWSSRGSTGNDSAFGSIQARRFVDFATPVGDEFQVNIHTTGNQVSPAIDRAADGSFVVVWTSFGSSPGNDNSGWSVQARRFASDATPLGDDSQVNSYTTGSQYRAAVAVAPDGDFVAVWETNTDVFGRRFASDGTPLGSDFQVNTYTTSFQYNPNVGVRSDGDFVVVWDSYGSSGPDTDPLSLQGQWFASDGSAVGGEFQVNSYTTGDQALPDVVFGPDDGFVVAWRSSGSAGTDTSDYSIQARRFASDGSALGDDFQVNSYTWGFQTRSRIAIQPAGDFVVSWQSMSASSGNDNSDYSIQARSFASDGTPLGDDFQVNTYTTGPQNFSKIDEVGGNFLVVWMSEGSAGSDDNLSSIQGQRYQSACTASQGLTAGQWKMISLPCDVGSADTVEDVFGDDMLPADYNVRWVVWERDEANQQYVQLELTDALAAGEGYWIVTDDGGQTVDVDGVSNQVVDTPLVGDAAAGRQNLVGHPFRFDVCWADVRVVDGGTELTLDEADPLEGFERACAQEPPAASCVMSRVAYKWTGAAYAAFDGETPGAEGTLEAFDGLWVKAFKSGLELRIPARGSSSCSAAKRRAASSDRQRKAGRGASYVRLIAEAAPLRSAGAVFGQLADGSERYDRHDLELLEPPGGSLLAVRFPHPDWGRRASVYATDFHPLSGGPDAWRFEVVAQPGERQVTLRWEGSARLIRSASLVDEASGETVCVELGGSYTFHMRGTRRAFLWQSGGKGTCQK